MFVLLIKLLTKSKTLTEIVYCLLFPRIHKTLFLFVCLLVFYATFNNISVISWRSVLLVEETGRPWEKHRPVESHWQTLSHNVVHIALIEIWTHNISGDTHWLHCKSNYHTVFVCPFVLLSFCPFFYFWSLCCMFFFDLRILICHFGIFKLFFIKIKHFMSICWAKYNMTLLLIINCLVDCILVL
jgi:hypothetical protein